MGSRNRVTERRQAARVRAEDPVTRNGDQEFLTSSTLQSPREHWKVDPRCPEPRPPRCPIWHSGGAGAALRNSGNLHLHRLPGGTGFYSKVCNSQCPSHVLGMSVREGELSAPQYASCTRPEESLFTPERGAEESGRPRGPRFKSGCHVLLHSDFPICLHPLTLLEASHKACPTKIIIPTPKHSCSPVLKPWCMWFDFAGAAGGRELSGVAAVTAEAAAGVGAFNSPIVTTLHTRGPHVPNRVPLTPFPGVPGGDPSLGFRPPSRP